MRTSFCIYFWPCSIAIDELTGEMQASSQTAAPRVFDKSNVQTEEAHVGNTKAKNQVHVKLAVVHSKVEEAVCIPRKGVAVLKECVSISLRIVHNGDIASKRNAVACPQELPSKVGFFVNAHSNVGRLVGKSSVSIGFDKPKCATTVAI